MTALLHLLPTKNKHTPFSRIQCPIPHQNKAQKVQQFGVEKIELTDNERVEREAMAAINANSAKVEVKASNGMWPFVSECHVTELKNKQDEPTFMRNQVNHNHVIPTLANEIANNFIGNPINADLNGKVHD